jgi:hypothetical protein
MVFDFPLVPGQPTVEAHVEVEAAVGAVTGSLKSQIGKPAARWIAWVPVDQEPAIGKAEDIAVLELGADADMPAGVAPASLIESDDFFDRSVRVCGFPEGMDEGDWLDGQLKGMIGTGRVQLDQALGSRTVAPGFSGSPVWDKGSGAVIGMIVSVGGRAGGISAYMTPVATLADAWPALKSLAAAPVEPARGPLLVSLRLPVEDLYVLKDRDQAREIGGVLVGRAIARKALPVFLIDCDPWTDALDGFIKRLGYELARDFKLAAPLEILDFGVPADATDDVERLARRHALDVAARVQLGPDKDPMARAVLSFHAVHLRDVDLKNEGGIALAVRLVRNWARASGPGNRVPPFFALLSTTEPHALLSRQNFASALEKHRGVELHDLGRLGPVNHSQLPRWAREANIHLPRPIRETAALAKNARQLIYGEREQMSMMDWFEGYSEQQTHLFGR